MQRNRRATTGHSGSWAAVATVAAAAVLVLSSVTQHPASATPTPGPSPAPSAAAPTVEPTTAPSVPAVIRARTTAPTIAPTPAPAPAPNTPGGLVVEHFVFAPIPDAGRAADYGATDAPLNGASRYDTVRIRFRIHNTGSGPLTVTPQLEYRATAAFVAVAQQSAPDAILYLGREWRTAAGGLTTLAPDNEPIAVTAMRLRADGAPERSGEHTMASNPAPALTLPAGTATEVEFTVRVGIAAMYSTQYTVRVTDAGAPLSGRSEAAVVIGPPPGSGLSAGQRTGVDVPDAPSGRHNGVAYPLSATSAVSNGIAARMFATTSGTLTASATAATAVHGPYTMTTDACGACHRGHTAAGPNLLARAAPTSTLCLSCHDGTGATDVSSQYTNPAVPPDDPTVREYYRHDALATSSHDLASNDEFGGVSNRHADCADCHNPHQAQQSNSVEGVDGWSTSGRLAGVSGVSVVNGAAGTAPTYTFRDGIAAPVTLEYQLCFKCHSGFTVLPSNTGVSPSRYELDKGVEFNPNNPSFHPIEAAGTNQTTAMAASLSGTSPYKLWDFTTTGTLRCTNCHAGGASQPGSMPADDAAPHASQYRGVLNANYRDRVLMSSREPYSAANFALCFTCHAEAPFVNENSSATNFEYHSLHLTEIDGEGSGGTDIDTAGAGQGRALCSECHFRLHSTTYQGRTQSVDGSRLVNFAPDVQGAYSPGTWPIWTRNPNGGGNCTLTCHGYSHHNEGY